MKKVLTQDELNQKCFDKWYELNKRQLEDDKFKLITEDMRNKINQIIELNNINKRLNKIEKIMNNIND